MTDLTLIQFHIVDREGLSRFVQVEVDLEAEQFVVVEEGNPRFVVGAPTSTIDAFGCAEMTHWWQGPVVCALCGHEWRAVVEIPRHLSSPGIPLQCPVCDTMSAGEQSE